MGGKTSKVGSSLELFILNYGSIQISFKIKLFFINLSYSVEPRTNSFRCNDPEILQNKETRNKNKKSSAEARACGLWVGGLRVSVSEPRACGQALVSFSNSGTCFFVWHVEYESLDWSILPGMKNMF